MRLYDNVVNTMRNRDNMIIVVCAFFCVLLPMMTTRALFGETWEHTFGGPYHDKAEAVQVTSDGGYVVAGWTESKAVGGKDVWVTKLSPGGHQEWERTFGGTMNDVAYDVRTTLDGGYIVAGHTLSKGEGVKNGWVIKLDAQGDMMWDRTFGNSSDEIHAVQTTSDGGYVTAGYAESNSAGYTDAWVLKLDAQGNRLWDVTVGGHSYDGAEAIQITPDNGYIVAGFTMSKGPSLYHGWVIKFDRHGQQMWDRLLDAPFAHAIQMTPDGGYIVASSSWPQCGGISTFDAWISKFDAQGHERWGRIVGSCDADDRAHDIQTTLDGRYIMAGYTETEGAGKKDALLIKFDKDGHLVWGHTFGGRHNDEATAIQVSPDGGYIVVGATESTGAGGSDAWVMKLNAEGVLNP